MVTCQSANQLKTPAKVSWAFKMVSQFGSLGYTIMGKTADLTVVQKTIWVNFTRNGLRLGSRHQESPHTDVSRNLATVVVFLLLSHSWTTDNVRGVLPGLRRRRTGLLPSGPKSSFQMRASFVLHLETKVLESGGRVEKLHASFCWPAF